MIENFINKIHNTDALSGLKSLPDKSIHCCVTSPPYFNLRNYNIEGQIGLEESPYEYISKLAEIFNEVKRVLRDDGTLWLNIGDTYAANRTYQCESTKGGFKHSPAQVNNKGSRVPEGLKSKDLIGIPWRLAFALQDSGWYLRSDIIWAKGISFNEKYSGSSMPESCKDRPSKSHEYLFLLTKSPKYFYDNMAVSENAIYASQHANKTTSWGSNRKHPNKDNVENYAFKGENHTSTVGGKRNLRSVWTINPKPYKGAHFAVFPQKLVEPCIKLGTSERGCCFECGEPYKRITEKGDANEEQKKFCGADNNGEYLGKATKDFFKNNAQDASAVKARILSGMKEIKTVGWKKECDCETNKIKPCVILDPFFGSGTVGLVAKEFGRDYLGIELNPEYVEIGNKRLNETQFQK